MENSNYKNIRQAAVAGQFYPEEAGVLEQAVKGYIKDAGASVHLGVHFNFVPKAIIVPHAGYDFSGPIAAHSYQQLEGITAGTVILLCNSHQAYFSGVAIDETRAWETPLGQIEVDRASADKLVKANDRIKYNGNAHVSDHVLEAQLPFLQVVLDNKFKILPILFGNSDSDDYKILANALANILDKNDIIVASTDLSHYPAYADANKIDKKTLEMIVDGDIEKLEKYIEEIKASGVENEQTVCCGIDGVKTVMELADIFSWKKAEVLHYANSGDAVIGDKKAVVGYGAAVFGKEDDFRRKDEVQNRNKLDDEQKKELLKIARETIEEFVLNNRIKEFDIQDERLNWKEGAFVTLYLNNRLRGCIGQIIPSGEPLWKIVRDMAIAAASEDPRFNPVDAEELKKAEYEISVLSAPEKIDNWGKIELGKHGVIVKKGFRSGVFLPQVADETGWDLEKFLQELCSQKAGLPADCYRDDPEIELQVFTAQVFR
ncbi:MAG: AmmeMemoRadiSam system protein B [Patescibacteria group bacterium]|nr:AmmeMemoRadiSam system protein B [Patescibacteria group bacterium]